MLIHHLFMSAKIIIFFKIILIFMTANKEFSTLRKIVRVQWLLEIKLGQIIQFAII